MLNVILQVRHEHQIAGLEVTIVEGVEVNMRQDRSRPISVGRIFRVDELAKLIHQSTAVRRIRSLKNRINFVHRELDMACYQLCIIIIYLCLEEEYYWGYSPS